MPLTAHSYVTTPTLLLQAEFGHESANPRSADETIKMLHTGPEALSATLLTKLGSATLFLA